MKSRLILISTFFLVLSGCQSDQPSASSGIITSYESSMPLSESSAHSFNAESYPDVDFRLEPDKSLTQVMEILITIEKTNIVLSEQMNELEKLGIPAWAYLNLDKVQTNELSNWGADAAITINTKIWEDELFGSACIPQAILMETDQYIQTVNKLAEDLLSKPEAITLSVLSPEGYYRTREFLLKLEANEYEFANGVSFGVSLDLMETVDTHNLMMVGIGTFLLNPDDLPKYIQYIEIAVQAMGDDPSVIQVIDFTDTKDDWSVRVVGKYANYTYTVVSNSRTFTISPIGGL